MLLHWWARLQERRQGPHPQAQAQTPHHECALPSAPHPATYLPALPPLPLQARGKKEEAHKSLQKYRGVDDVDAELRVRRG